MKRISRRNFLKVAGVGAAALGLAACGSSSSSTGSSTTSSAAASATPAEDVTIKVAAIETAYGSEMWQKVADAFTTQTGIKVELQASDIPATMRLRRTKFILSAFVRVRNSVGTCHEITARRQVQLSEFLTESHPLH